VSADEAGWERLGHMEVLARGDLRPGMEAWLHAEGAPPVERQRRPVLVTALTEAAVALSGPLPDGPVEVSLFSPGGVYYTQLLPVARTADGVTYAPPVAWLRRNRRGAFRLGVSWPAEVASIVAPPGTRAGGRRGPIPVRVADVSPIGARLSGLSPEPGSIVRVRVLLADAARQPQLEGRVIYRREVPVSTGQRFAFCGIAFTELDRPSERALVRRIMDEQRRLLQQLRR
jgi:hypothetical protein